MSYYFRCRWRAVVMVVVVVVVAAAAAAAVVVAVVMVALAAAARYPPSKQLKHGSYYYHSSFQWMGIFNAVGPLLGLPFVTGSLPPRRGSSTPSPCTCIEWCGRRYCSAAVCSFRNGEHLFGTRRMPVVLEPQLSVDAFLQQEHR
jgi:hypothetical protein